MSSDEMNQWFPAFKPEDVTELKLISNFVAVWV